MRILKLAKLLLTTLMNVRNRFLSERSLEVDENPTWGIENNWSRFCTWSATLLDGGPTIPWRNLVITWNIETIQLKVTYQRWFMPGFVGNLTFSVLLERWNRLSYEFNRLLQGNRCEPTSISNINPQRNILQNVRVLIDFIDRLKSRLNPLYSIIFSYFPALQKSVFLVLRLLVYAKQHAYLKSPRICCRYSFRGCGMYRKVD